MNIKSLAWLMGGGLLLAVTPAQADERRAIEVPPRTPLYCEDDKANLQPLIYGDFGDLVNAYGKMHWSALVTPNGKRASGEDDDVLLLQAPENDPNSPGELVGYVLTRFQDGYAIRSAYDQPRGSPTQKSTGTELCFFVLKMIVDADPARASAFNRKWREKHQDSTTSP